MRLGPIVLMKDSTFRTILHNSDVLTEQNSNLSAKLGAGITTHSFMHYPWTATTAPAVFAEPDEPGPRVDEAVARIIAAFQKCMKEYVNPSPGMWDGIEQRNKRFLTALREGNADELKGLLGRLFRNDLIWGLGKFDEALANDMTQQKEHSHAQLRITDALVSLAQAAGALTVTCVEQQGIETHLNCLAVNLEQVLSCTENRLGFSIASAQVGSIYGCRIGSTFVTIDSLLHAYTAHRLLQLGAGPDSQIAEIGGGFGCLAGLAYRAGCRKYAIYDLPWVNAIQGYYLLMSQPAETVALYGEKEAAIAVKPFWAFEKIPKGSVDYVVNTDSLPEMGHDTANAYIRGIKHLLSDQGIFLSMNQEAQASNAGFGAQNNVAAMIERVGGFRKLGRFLYWMRQGYVEEIFQRAPGT